MAKISFDIKYRPQIESGEYKVEFDGKPARIICWDKKRSKDNATIVALIDDGESEHTEYFFSDGMALCATAPALRIITPEEELTDFEKAIKEMMRGYVKMPDEVIKETSAKLFAIALKELQPKIDAEIENAYKNADNIVYENGVLYGKAEALKDLPRWRKVGVNTGQTNLIRGYSREEDELYRNGKCISLVSLEKLPGFKED